MQPRSPDRRYRVWIDARDPRCAFRVFGMGLVERHLRALLAARLEFLEVVIEHVPEAPIVISQALQASLPIQFAIQSAGTPSALLARLSDGGEAVWLVLDGTTLVDPRLLAALAGCDRASVAWGAPGQGERPFAARLDTGLPPAGPGGLAGCLLAWQRGGAVKELALDSLPGYLPKLRRTLPPYCLRVTDSRSRDEAEHFLFGSNYKGSTDFFTKYVYPPLVWRLVRPLSRLRVHPNWVSLLNVILTVAAVPLFAAAHWVAGLACAYAMSVLDSVDGKLARLTFSDSKIGHVLDHGLDVVHPPFWYAAWAWALDGGHAGPCFHWSLALAGVYFLDRVATEIFTRTTGRSIHAFEPIDVRMRTWISRRNINVPLFTIGLVLGFPNLAFGVIVAWQLLTFLFHAVRLGQANRWWR